MKPSRQGIRYKTETHRFGPYKLKIKRVQNLDDLIDQISDEEFNQDERLPYWAELWPSAIALSHFLTAYPKLIEGKSVLELGAGLGLTSLIAHQLTPSRLLLTDYEKDALDMIKENFRLNGLPQPDIRLLDWRSPRLTGTFDRIMASDILYEERFFQPLIHLFENFLNAEGKVIIAEPNRAIAQIFFAMLKERGFGWYTSTLTVPEDPKPIQVTVYVISRQ